MKSKKMFKDATRRLTVASLVTCLAFGGINKVPFADSIIESTEIMTTEVLANDLGISNHWSEPYMENMYNRGLITGDEYGNLNPAKNISRAEFVSIANRAFGYDETGLMPFEDVIGNEWYARDINVAFNQGYFSGLNETEAAATSPLTREQTVSLLSRNLNLPENYHETDKFIDSKNVSTWAIGVVNASTDKGYLSGYEDGSFKPQNYITRGEVAKILTTSLGHLIDTPSTQTLGYLRGNVTVASSDVILQDTVVDGDLFITAGVGKGHITLDGVVVLGEVIVSGTGVSYAGDSSVRLIDTSISKLTIAGANDTYKTISSEGETIVDEVYVTTNAFLEEINFKNNGFKSIILDGEPYTTLRLSGIYDDIMIVGGENKLYLDSGMIDTLVIDEEAIGSVITLEHNTYVDNMYFDAACYVTGTGEIGYAKVNVDGVVMDQIPEFLEIRPGVTATVAGMELDSAGAEALSSPPRINSSYPVVDPLTGGGGTAQVQTNKAGTVSWAVTLAADGPATADELIRLDPLNSNLLQKGTVPIALYEELTFPIIGLEKYTEYVLSVLLTDAKGETSSVRYEYFTTADDTASSFAPGFPAIDIIWSDYITFDVVLNRTADFYWAVYTPDMPAPVASALRNGDLPESISNNKNEVNKQLTKLNKATYQANGLEPVTSYILYTMAADGNNTSPVVATPFTTVDTTPPIIITATTTKEDSKSDTQAMVNVDEYAFLYYAVYSENASFPIQDPNYGLEIASSITYDDSLSLIVDTEDGTTDDGTTDDGTTDDGTTDDGTTDDGTTDDGTTDDGTTDDGTTDDDTDSDSDSDSNTDTEIPYISLDSDEAKEQLIKGTSSVLNGATKAYDAKADIIFQLKGLDSTKGYNLYIMAEDSYGNLSDIREIYVPVQPAFTDDFPISVHNLEDPLKVEGRTPTHFEFRTIKECNIYWAIMEGHKNIAPTAEELMNLDLIAPPTESLARGVTNIPTKNTRYSSQPIYETLQDETLAYGLAEVEEFTLYAVLRDVASNGSLYSEVYEYKFKTPDSTIPKGTAWFETNTVNSIELKAVADEDVKLYYSMVYAGAPLISIPEGYEGPENNDNDQGSPYYSDLWGTDPAIAQVISGYNSRKFGNQSLKENIEGSIKLTGLIEEQAYDFYYVLEDSTGNRSNIQIIKDITTLDATPPNATLEFSVVDISGNPTTDTALTIAFDETVEAYEINPVSGVKTSMKFTDMFLSDGVTIDQDKIMEHISFYQIADHNPKIPMEPVFGTFQVTPNLRTPPVGKYYTTITFVPDSYELVSNGTYFFEIKNIQDVSGNEMIYTDQNLQFTTEAPLINFLDLLKPTSTKQFTYKLTPQNIDVADDTYFDIIIESTETILIDLYQYSTTTYEYELMGMNLSIPAGTSKGVSQMKEPERNPNTGLVEPDANGYVNATELYLGPSLLNERSDGIKDTYGEKTGYHDGEYAIAIKQVNGKDIELGVETDLNIKMYGIMGPETIITSYAQTANPDMSSVTYKSLSLVSYVTANMGNEGYEHILEMAYGFRDSIPPKFENESPVLLPMATSVATKVQSDKTATFHYVIIPRGESDTPLLGQIRFPAGYNYETGEYVSLTDEEWAEVDQYGDYSLTSAQTDYLMLVGDAYTVSDAQAGTIEDLYPGMMSGTEYLGDLLPATTDKDENDNIIATYGTVYDFYGFLKGDATETSTIYYQEFETVPAEAPDLTASLNFTNETQTSIRFETDVFAEVYYMLVQGVGYTGNPEDVTTGMILGEGGVPAIARGVTTTEYYSIGDNKYNNIILLPEEGVLADGVTYHLYAFASVIGSDTRSNISTVAYIKTVDSTGPQIKMLSAPTGYLTSLSEEYSGKVIITFSEGLYINNVQPNPDPLTIENASTYIKASQGEVYDQSTAAVSDDILSIKYYTSEISDTGTKAILSVTMDIKGATYNSTIYSVTANGLYDEIGNAGGELMLRLDFSDNPFYDGTLDPTIPGNADNLKKYQANWVVDDSKTTYMKMVE